MVKILIQSTAIGQLRAVYNKTIREKAIHLWKYLENYNPTLATLWLPLTLLQIPFSIGVLYLKKNVNSNPRYYEVYTVMRPDDPRVMYLRKDDSLRIQESYIAPIIHPMPAMHH